MRKYIQNSSNRVALFRDKLFINWEQYIPPSDTAIKSQPGTSEFHSRRGERLTEGDRRYVQGARPKQQSQQQGVKTFSKPYSYLRYALNYG